MLIFLIVAGLGFAILVTSLLLDGILDSILPSFDAPGSDLISGPALGAFMAAFGATGAIATSAGTSTAIATILGLATGLALGAIVSMVTRSLMRSATDDTPRSDDLIGLPATVITTIPTDGYGQVSVRLGGAPHMVNARATTAVPAGTPVTVTAVLSPTSVSVTPATADDPN